MKIQALVLSAILVCPSLIIASVNHRSSFEVKLSVDEAHLLAEALRSKPAQDGIDSSIGKQIEIWRNRDGSLDLVLQNRASANLDHPVKGVGLKTQFLLNATQAEATSIANMIDETVNSNIPTSGGSSDYRIACYGPDPARPKKICFFELWESGWAGQK